MRCNNLRKGKILMPTFSIIVPIYKTEEYLEKCIDSILKQTYKDFELILVDDGSPDKCPFICDEYKKKDFRIKVLHKKNGGVSSARNQGLCMATGEYIWFVDSDDYIEPDALQKLNEVQQKPGADLCVFNSKLEEIECLDSINNFFNQYYFTYKLGFEPWNKIYRREIIQKYNLEFDTQETIGEDLLFNIQYYKAIFDIVPVTVSLKRDVYYQYVDREGSAMNTAFKTRICQQLRLFDKIEETLRNVLEEKKLIYLFFMHLISGIGQSKQGGLSCLEFSKIDFRKYRNWINKFKVIQNKFFANENASRLGRIRIQLFVWLMTNKKYKLAGKVMGLK